MMKNQEAKRLFDVVVVGELNPDLIFSGNAVPEFNQVEKLVDRATLTIGSSAAIFACGAARLGLQVAFLGKVGNDLYGEFMRSSLGERGIDTRGIVIDKKTPTGISVILTNDKDRAILTFPGTIPSLSYNELDQKILHQARHLHVASYFIQEALRPNLPKLFADAKSAGLSISLDTNFDPLGKWELEVDEILKSTDLFLPNEVECLRIARKSTLEAATEYLQKKVNYLGVKMGEKGAILCHASKKYQMNSLKVVVADTVGAGDTFDAGFVYGYLKGWEPERILRMAVVCGSLSTRQPGGTSAQPTFDEAKQYL